MRRATKAETTEPKEKKTERAVTRYCFALGMCSRRSVPSVGMEPCTNEGLSHRSQERRSGDERPRTPTALPKKNRAMHNVRKVLAKEAARPKTAVKKSVALKAALRPRRSEP